MAALEPIVIVFAGHAIGFHEAIKALAKREADRNADLADALARSVRPAQIDQPD